jgi:hypothetical protein
MKKKLFMLAFGLILAGCGDNGSAGSAALSAPSGVSAGGADVAAARVAIGRFEVFKPTVVRRLIQLLFLGENV